MIILIYIRYVIVSKFFIPLLLHISIQQSNHAYWLFEKRDIKKVWWNYDASLQICEIWKDVFGASYECKRQTQVLTKRSKKITTISPYLLGNHISSCPGSSIPNIFSRWEHIFSPISKLGSQNCISWILWWLIRILQGICKKQNIKLKVKPNFVEGRIVQSIGSLLSMVGRMIINPPPPLCYHLSL